MTNVYMSLAKNYVLSFILPSGSPPPIGVQPPHEVGLPLGDKTRRFKGKLPLKFQIKTNYKSLWAKYYLAH